ncbi:hypothetical protein V2G26_008301 [Clonostachys chloroleuca]
MPCWRLLSVPGPSPIPRKVSTIRSVLVYESESHCVVLTTRPHAIPAGLHSVMTLGDNIEMILIPGAAAVSSYPKPEMICNTYFQT